MLGCKNIKNQIDKFFSGIENHNNHLPVWLHYFTTYLIIKTSSKIIFNILETGYLDVPMTKNIIKKKTIGQIVFDRGHTNKKKIKKNRKKGIK